MQLEDYGLVQFLPLDITNEDSIGELLLFIDNAIQFGEDEDIKVPKVFGKEFDYCMPVVNSEYWPEISTIVKV